MGFAPASGKNACVFSRCVIHIGMKRHLDDKNQDLKAVDRPCGRGRGGRRGGGCRRGRWGSRGIVEATLLASLSSPRHGYDLRQGLIADASLPAIDPGGLYRMLRRLEKEGLVQSDWVEGEAGPMRREYVLTQEGKEALNQWADDLKKQRDTIDALLRAIADKDGDKPNQRKGRR